MPEFIDFHLPIYTNMSMMTTGRFQGWYDCPSRAMGDDLWALARAASACQPPFIHCWPSLISSALIFARGRQIFSAASSPARRWSSYIYRRLEIHAQASSSGRREWGERYELLALIDDFSCHFSPRPEIFGRLHRHGPRRRSPGVRQVTRRDDDIDWLVIFSLPA